MTNDPPSQSHDIAWSLGTIGFAYADWNGPFYPPGTSGPNRLSHYAQYFNAVEVDATFHAIPAAKTVQRWGDAVPVGFNFCLKTPREITHSSDAGNLLKPETRMHMRQFLAVGSELGDKLSVILIQFPGTCGVDRHDELAEFLSGLPGEHRYAVELRQDSWWVPRTAELFRELGVCWVAADEVKKHEADSPPGLYKPRPIVPTTDYLYIRWIGWHEQFPDLAREHLNPVNRLAWWDARLNAVLSKRPELNGVFGFFGNGYSGHAPATCRRFADVTGVDLERSLGGSSGHDLLFHPACDV
ncbi:MAG: DUF72 domain-containing protein [Planctomycetota bacterium]